MPQLRSIKIIKSVDRDQPAANTASQQKFASVEREELRIVKGTLTRWVNELHLRNRKPGRSLTLTFGKSPNIEVDQVAATATDSIGAECCEVET